MNLQLLLLNLGYLAAVYILTKTVSDWKYVFLGLCVIMILNKYINNVIGGTRDITDIVLTVLTGLGGIILMANKIGVLKSIGISLGTFLLIRVFLNKYLP